MPYTTNTLSYLAGGPVEGAWKLWEYTTTDAISTVLGSGYVADATIKAMAVGDFVIVVNQTNPAGLYPAGPVGHGGERKYSRRRNARRSGGRQRAEPGVPPQFDRWWGFHHQSVAAGHELYRHQQRHIAGGLYGRSLVRLQQQCQRLYFGVAGHRNNGRCGVLSGPADRPRIR